MFTYPGRCVCVFEAVVLNTNQFIIENNQILNEFLLTSVRNSKRVQFIKESFSNLINVLWIQIFNTITACRLMKLSFWRFVEESITNGATKELEYCIDIDHDIA